MTSEEREFVSDLLSNKVSREEFLKQFRSSTDGRELGRQLIKEAYEQKTPVDLQYALVVAFRFGFLPSSLDILCQLAEEHWHFCHEDVISAIAQFKDSRTVEVLYKATQYVPEYLAFDDARALAVKAIWALGAIQSPEADEKLRLLSRSKNKILRRNAKEQIVRRSHDEPG